MNQERLMKVIVAPHVSEKSNILADKHKQFVFRVLNDASKPEIAAAIELLFKVKVAAVHTLNVKGKSRRFGQIQGRRKDWKKAYVTLQEGQEISFEAAEAA